MTKSGVTKILALAAEVEAAMPSGMLSPRERDQIRNTLGLSQREFEVALCIMDEMSNQRAARALRISEHTFDSHVRRIFAKLDIRNRASVVSQLFVAFVQSRSTRD